MTRRSQRQARCLALDDPKDGTQAISRRESRMEFGVPPVGAPETAAAARPTGGVRRPQGAGPDFLVTLTSALEGPPAELRADVEGAARRYEELRAMRRE